MEPASVHEQVAVAVVPVRGERDGLQGAAGAISDLASRRDGVGRRKADAGAGGLQQGGRIVHGERDCGDGERRPGHRHAYANSHRLADAYPDPNSHRLANSHANAYPHAYPNSDSLAYANSDPYPHSDADPIPYPYPYAYPYPHAISYADSNAIPYPNSDSLAYPISYAIPYPYAYPYGNAYTDAYPNSYADPIAHRYPDADAESLRLQRPRQRLVRLFQERVGLMDERLPVHQQRRTLRPLL